MTSTEPLSEPTNGKHIQWGSLRVRLRFMALALISSTYVATNIVICAYIIQIVLEFRDIKAALVLVILSGSINVAGFYLLYWFYDIKDRFSEAFSSDLPGGDWMDAVLVSVWLFLVVVSTLYESKFALESISLFDNVYFMVLLFPTLMIGLSRQAVFELLRA